MYSDMTDSNSDEDHIARSVPLAEVDSLHPMATPAESDRTSVASMSEWRSKFNDAFLRSNFKIFRRLVSVDELSAQHFFLGEVDLVSITPQLQVVFDYAVEATKCIDTSEKDLFCNSVAMASKLANRIVQDSSVNFIIRELKKRGSELEQMISSQIQGRIHKWIIDLHQLLLKLPKDCPERKYEELARNFFELFGLHCTMGDAEQFVVQYDDGDGKKQILSHPDLLLRQVKSGAPYCAVIEVKSMVVDPEFKHLSAKPQKANLKTSTKDSSEDTSTVTKRKEGFNPDEDKSGKRRRVSFTLSDDPAEEKTQETLHARSFDESSLSSEVRTLLDTFFGQLFGGVMALDCFQSLLPKKVMGIGVVGFKMIFMSFQQRDNISFHKVCETPGSRIDVYMTNPLSMLKAADRQEIMKILLLLATENVA